MIDIHSHFLFGIDDGAKTIEESMEILKKSYKDGVHTIVATPHFYGEYITVDEFLCLRQQSYDAIIKKADEEGIKIPEIILGAEVHIDKDTASRKDLKKLCIGDTKYILLELPYIIGGKWVFDHIYHIMSHYYLRPVIAHVERYIPCRFSGFGKVSSLMDMDVTFQVNADSFLKKRSLKSIKKLIKNGYPLCLGSDVHNTDVRPTRIAEARDTIITKFGEDLFDEMQENAELLLENKYL